MEVFETARFNTYWLLWLLAPMVVMLSAAYIRKRRVTILAVIASLSLTYALSNFAVTEKWKKRVETAQSEQQMQKATADGANKVFTLLFFAPLEAVFFTWFWFWLGRKVWRPQNDRLD